MWRGVGEHLSDLLTLSAFDLPGHGRGPAWDGTTDLHRACCDTALPYLTAPLHLIGHSFGATVALRLAVENPQMVRSLTLFEPVFFAALNETGQAHLATHITSAIPWTEAIERGDFALAARLFNRQWGDGTRWVDIPEKSQHYMTERVHMVPAQAPAIFDDNAGLLRSGAAERADMPVMLVRGARSLEVTGHINHALAERLPDAHEVTIEGAGHMAPVTHARESAEAIRSLVEMTEERVNLRGCH